MNGMLQTLKQLYQSIAVHEDLVYLIYDKHYTTFEH